MMKDISPDSALLKNEAVAAEVLNSMTASVDLSDEDRRVFTESLSALCTEIYELDYENNTFRVLRTSLNTDILQDGPLHEALPILMQYVHETDREEIGRLLSTNLIFTQFHGQPFLRRDLHIVHRDGNSCMYPVLLVRRASEYGNESCFYIVMLEPDDTDLSHALIKSRRRINDLSINMQRYKAIMRHTDTLDFEWTPDTGHTYISPEIHDRFPADYEGRKILRVWIEDHIVHPQDAETLRDFTETLERYFVCPLPVTVRLRRADGQYIWCRVAATMLEQRGKKARVIGTLNDVHKETEALRQLKFRAEFDALTELLNRETFFDRTAELLKAHPEKQYIILRLDFDRFKLVNEFHGMAEGDRLLRTTAGIIKKKLGSDTTCGRIGGDVFCICMPAMPNEALQFFSEVSEEIKCHSLRCNVSLNAGLCLVEHRSTPVHLLCDWAGLALATIKGNYFRNYAFYNSELHDRVLLESQIEAEMTEALESGQFRLYLQPKVDIATGKIISAEALSRWMHPKRGLMPPSTFIPVLERSGFLHKLDEHVWEQSCRTIRSWIDKGLQPIPISVNVSRTHFHNADLCTKLLNLVKAYKTPPELLELEITESAYLENEQVLFEIIAELQTYGFHFSMDDFGTGYSSLSTLKNLPLNTVKIDRNFLKEGIGSERGRLIIQHTISLAQEMNMQVVAEGVETTEQADYLLRANCRVAQGFLYSPPVPCLEFEGMAFKRIPQFPVSETIRHTLEEIGPRISRIPVPETSHYSFGETAHC